MPPSSTNPPGVITGSEGSEESEVQGLPARTGKRERKADFTSMTEPNSTAQGGWSGIAVTSQLPCAGNPADLGVW